MVGVPGRSKACHNCRQRRVKCDGKRPECDNCTKFHRLCTGYQRNHAFILSRDMAIKESDAEPVGHAGTGQVLVARWRVAPNQVSTLASQCRNLPGPTFEQFSPSVMEISSGSAYRDRLFGSFLDCQLPVSRHSRIAFSERSWIQDVLNLAFRSPSLEHAILAICAARLGRSNSHADLVHKSLSFYTTSVRELGRALQVPAMLTDEQNFIAAYALLLYEIWECPGRTVHGYLSHYNGVMELLRLRGPGAHKSGLAHGLFRVVRLHAVFQSFGQRSTSFLAESAWRELPWTSSDRKSHMDMLIDILLEIPTLAAQSDALDKMASPRARLRDGLETISQGQHLESRLAEWFGLFDNTVTGALYHPKLSEIRSPADDRELGKVFPVALWFPAFIVGQHMLYYWVGLLVVQVHMCCMYQRLDRLMATLEPIRDAIPCICCSTEDVKCQSLAPCLRHFETSSLPPLGDRLYWPKTTAYNICQSVEYFLQDKMHSIGATAVLPALAVVKTCWEFWPGDWRREIAWVNDMFARIRLSGNEIAELF
ncbi:hypothetical protein BJ170DRAFT_496560 [Xylariales sp. AK1849]|nr:hypothetical protein BJ170DRAFT_496560 [Xylariales sp. AK1849]